MGKELEDLHYGKRLRYAQCGDLEMQVIATQEEKATNKIQVEHVARRILENDRNK